MGALHSFSIKNIFYYKMDLRLFYFDVTIFRKCFIIDVWHGPYYASEYQLKSIRLWLVASSFDIAIKYYFCERQ